jgi:hypothetical protein
MTPPMTAEPILDTGKSGTGPATGISAGRVLETDGGRALVELDSGARAWADPAMPVRYAPAVGDQLLTAGDGERFWIIGVVQGTGAVSVTGFGDVEVRSIGGTLRLGGTEATEVQTGRLSIMADSVSTVARTVRESIGSLIQVVTGRRVVRSGSDFRVVEGTAFQRSERMHAVASKEVRIDGTTVHLG